MEQPQENERIVCPDSGEKLIPERVWDTQKPNGERVRYGIFKKHHHYRQPCDWNGLPSEVVPINKGD